MRPSDLLGDKRRTRAVSISNSFNVDPVLEPALFGLTPVQLSRNLELTAAKSNDLTVVQRPIERLGEFRIFALNLTPDSGKSAFAWIQRTTAGGFETERRNDR